MLLDAGILWVHKLHNTAPAGQKPVEKLVKHSWHYYGERTVGYGRQYAAMGVSERVDLLVRIWQDRTVRIGMVAVPEDGEQYRIGNVQHLLDEDGLQVTDLSLERMDRLYEHAEDS